MSPSHTTTSGDWASARSTAASNDRSKSRSRWLTPASSTTLRYARPRWASPMAAIRAMSVDQRRDVGGHRGAGGRRGGRVAAHVGPQVDLGRHSERGGEVGDQALAGHERLDLRAEGGDVLLGRAAQDVAVLLVGQAQ